LCLTSFVLASVSERSAAQD